VPMADSACWVAHVCSACSAALLQRIKTEMLTPTSHALIDAPQEEAFRKREEALKRRDLELQESLIRFSKFLQENDSKRARAEKKAADEVRARQAKEVEIGKLAEVMEQLSEEKDRVDSVVDKRLR
jgi:hypothetical protein